MGKKIEPDDGGSPIRRLALVIGAVIYIAGFLALVYVVSVVRPQLGSYAPFNVAAPQSINAPSSPTPLRINSSPVSIPPVTAAPPEQPVALASPSLLPASVTLTPGSAIASGKTRAVPIRTLQAKTPRAELSPCAKPSGTERVPKTALSGPNPIIAPAAKPITAPPARPVIAPPAKPVTATPAKPITARAARQTASPTRGGHAASVTNAARSRPPAKHGVGSTTTASEEERRSFVLLLPVPKSRGDRVSNDLDPRTDPRGSLLIHPPTAPTPPASSSDSQTQ